MPDRTRVSAIMTSPVITVSPVLTVAEAAEVLADQHIGASPVVDTAGKVVGMLRDEDLLVSEARLHVPTVIEFLGAELVWPPSVHRYEDELRRAAAATVALLMTTEVDTVRSTDTVETVATLMHDKRLSHVPVVDDGVLVGMVARADLVRFVASMT
jgi:CBS domain-containing protein